MDRSTTLPSRHMRTNRFIIATPHSMANDVSKGIFVKSSGADSIHSRHSAPTVSNCFAVCTSLTCFTYKSCVLLEEPRQTSVYHWVGQHRKKLPGQIWPGKGPIWPDPFLGQTDPESGSNWHEIWVQNVFLTWIPGQSDLVFWSGLTQKWVWQQGTLSGSNPTLEFLEWTS